MLRLLLLLCERPGFGERLHSNGLVATLQGIPTSATKVQHGYIIVIIYSNIFISVCVRAHSHARVCVCVCVCGGGGGGGVCHTIKLSPLL